MTASLTFFSCLPSIRNGTGEGFLAIDTNGVRYRFDWMARYGEPPLRSKNSTGANVILPRARVVLYATRVEDRFGNWVEYEYTNPANQPARLTRIHSNDGRALAVAYNASGHIGSVNDGQNTWLYQYDYSVPSKGSLTAVVLPDQSRWSFDFAALTSARILYHQSREHGDVWRSCFEPGDVTSPAAVGTVVHPSGAIGEFEVTPTRHGRSNVPAVCGGFTLPQNDDNDDVAYYVINWDALSLTRKQVSGPGLQPSTWRYQYGSQISWYLHPSGNGYPVCMQFGGCIEPQCTSDTCAGSSWTTVTGPLVRERYTFGNSYRYNEGKLLRVETGPVDGPALRVTASTYNLAQSGQAYPTPMATSPQPRGDGFINEFTRPLLTSVVTQEGTPFSSQVTQFDDLARPLAVTKWSATVAPKQEATAFHDNASLWVLGQPAVTSVDGVEAARVEYDHHAQPVVQHRFGQLQHTLAYHGDGTLSSVTDARGLVTRLEGWKRGVPQSIQHPDGTTQTATVNDSGWITSVTDENGDTTSYGHDAMGRIASVAHPAGDSTAWHPTTQAFQQVGHDEYGIGAGHWRQTIATGDARKVTYFDGLWRPLLSHEYDAADVAGTQRFQRFAYDAEGRTTFASYPSAAAAALTGTWNEYDALGRTTSVSQDSEHGLLTTRTQYLPGLRTRVTNPRGFVTEAQHQAWDTPAYELPVRIDASVGAPEASRTTIGRDVFGKPLFITRGAVD